MRQKMLMLVAALALVFACAARAEGNMFMETEKSSPVYRMFGDGETLYAVGQDCLYTWRTGDTALTAWKDEVSLPTPEDSQNVTQWRSGFDDLYLFLMDDRLCGVRLVGGEGGEDQWVFTGSGAAQAMQLCDLVLEEGEARAANVRVVGLPKALLDAGVTGVREMHGQDGTLYMLLFDGEYETVLCAADVGGEDVRVEKLGGWAEYNLVPTAGGVLLATQDFESDRLILERLGRDGSRVPVCALAMLEPASIAGAADSDAVYVALDGRIRPVDLETGELGEAVSAAPLPPDCATLAAGGCYYAAGIDGHVALMDVTGHLDERGVLTVRGIYNGPAVNEAILRFMVAHPGITPTIVNDGVGQELLDEMLTQTAGDDIYLMEDMYNAPYEALLERGYMLPLDGSEALSGLIGRMYPGVREKLSHDGAACAVPILLSGSGLGMSEKALERLGLALSDVPDDWEGFLDFIEQVIRPRLGGLGAGARFTYDEVSEDEFRRVLSMGILNGWVCAAEAVGMLPDYEDARLVALLERVEDMDLSGYGLDEGGNDDEFGGYSWGSGTHYLISLNTEYGFSRYGDAYDQTPLVLGFGEDMPGALAYRMHAAFVNPYSAHPDEAVALLETLAGCLDQTLLYALCPDLTEPLRRPDEAEMIEHYETGIANARAALEAAEPKDRQMWEETVRQWEEDYETFRRESVWLIPKARLDWYRSHDDHVIAASPSWFETDESDEAWDLLIQYQAGLLSSREFLSAVNRKARMAAMEGM